MSTFGVATVICMRMPPANDLENGTHLQDPVGKKTQVFGKKRMVFSTPKTEKKKSDFSNAVQL